MLLEVERQVRHALHAALSALAFLAAAALATGHTWDAAALGHRAELRHHLLHFLELRQQAVDLGTIDARAGSDSPPAGMRDLLRVATLPRGHAADDGFDLLVVIVCDLGVRLAQLLADTRDHLDELAERAHLLDLLELIQEVLEVELALEHAVLHAFGLVLICLLLRSLNERQDVAHTQDAPGEPIRVEGLEGIQLLAGTDELDRHAGDRADREGGTTAGVAVHLGEDKPGDAETLVECFRNADRFLASHRVRDEQDLG